MPKTIPFFDLKKQNKMLKRRMDAVWHSVTGTGDFVLGKRVETFEKEFSAYTGTNFAVGVSTGLDALALSLRAIGIGQGDEVIVPANTFIASALAVSSAGARPVFCDVDEATLLVDVHCLQKAWTKKTKAVVPVHLYGQPVRMGEVTAWAKARKLHVIEDACQAHGASDHGKKPGSFGTAGCFSFFPSKNLGAYGDGGMITTQDERVYEKVKLLRNYGSVVKYRHDIEGCNMRLDALQAGVLSEKLKHLDIWNAARNRLARFYDKKLFSIKSLRLLPRREGCFNAYHLYIVRTDRRDELRTYLEKRGILTGIHYPIPIHLQKAYQSLGYRKGSFPVSERSSTEVLSLPMYPEMALADAERVCGAVLNFFR